MITLGINYNKTHDSAACIVRDGEVVFAVAEERLSRIKHDASFPQMAIRACLDFADVRSDQLDEVCFGWSRASAGFRHDLKCLATGGLPLTYLNVVTTTMYFLSMWHQESGAKRFRELFGGASVSSTLFTIGWLRRGELWESVAIPEIRSQAADIARRFAPPE